MHSLSSSFEEKSNSKIGKVRRKTNPRISSRAEAQSLFVIEMLIREGVLDEDGSVDRVVLLGFYRSKFLKLIQDEWDIGGRISHQQVREELLKKSRIKPRRWADLSQRFRHMMLLSSTMCDQDRFRAFTLWLGEDIIGDARSSDQPLAVQLRKRLTESLTQHLGANRFGFWFHLERTVANPDALHVHGLMYVTDGQHLTNSKLRKKLRETITKASGSNHLMDPARILKMPQQRLTPNWVDYCRKQRREKSYQLANSTSPSEIYGYQLAAGTDSYTKRAKQFYEKMRRIVPALLSGEIETWTPEQWGRVTWNLPLVEFK